MLTHYQRRQRQRRQRQRRQRRHTHRKVPFFCVFYTFQGTRSRNISFLRNSFFRPIVILFFFKLRLCGKVTWFHPEPRPKSGLMSGRARAGFNGTLYSHIDTKHPKVLRNINSHFTFSVWKLSINSRLVDAYIVYCNEQFFWNSGKLMMPIDRAGNFIQKMTQ